MCFETKLMSMYYCNRTGGNGEFSDLEGLQHDLQQKKKKGIKWPPIFVDNLRATKVLWRNVGDVDWKSLDTYNVI